MVRSEFEEFVASVEPALRRAFAGHLDPSDVGDALGEAFGWAWEHWDEVAGMENPSGFLFRVGQSRTRRRRAPSTAPPDPVGLPQVEPGLAGAMRRLPAKQRSVVWLVHGCGWTYAETAEALGMSTSAVGTHVGRALDRLRAELGVEGGH